MLYGKLGQGSLISQENYKHNLYVLKTHQIIALNEQTKVFKQSTNETSISVSVKEFGALGDSITDDTLAIQSAIDSVFGNGGGIILFPAGIYKVSINPNTLQAISLHSKVILQGDGKEQSIIRMANSQGNYIAMLAGETPDSDLSDMAIYDLTIDSNGQNNPVIKDSDLLQGKGRFAVQAFVGSRIRLERNRFINHRGTQTVITSVTNDNENLVTDVVIKDNIFEAIGGDDIDYDHSTIYAHGKGIQIINNSFYTKYGAGTKGARTAIETHGDEFKVINNKIFGYTNGINVTGVARTSINQNISYNTIENVHTGITIWSYYFNGNKDKTALLNCSISNNKIKIDVKSWHQLWQNLPSQGIVLHSASNAPIDNLKIIDNEIEFTNFQNSGGKYDMFSSGISLSRNSVAFVLSKNIEIQGNKIINTLGSGIYISMPTNNLKIYQNTITSPWRSNLGTNRDSIILEGDLSEVNVSENNYN